jgi:hypothetical protein
MGETRRGSKSVSGTECARQEFSIVCKLLEGSGSAFPLPLLNMFINVLTPI